MNANKITDLFKRLSFGNGNMITPGDNSFSFRIDCFPYEIPKDVHFTFGYHRETGDVNLHVTRNVKDQNNKPHVKVIIFRKDAFDAALPKLAAKLFKLCLIPFALFRTGKKIKYKVYQQRRFLDLNEIGKWCDYKEGEFLPEAAKHFKKKSGKGKYEMQESLGKGIQEWSKTKFRMKVMRAEIKPLCEMDLMKTVCGLLFSAEYNGPALIMNGGIYIIRESLEPLDLFTTILGITTLSQLTKKIKDAVHTVQYARSYDDIKDMGEPIRLFNSYSIDT